MFKMTNYHKENYAADTRCVIFAVLTVLAISIQPGTLRAQGVQDNLERIDKAALSTPSWNPVSGFTAARPGPAPLFAGAPHGAGAPGGMAPITTRPWSESKPERARRTPFLIGLYATQVTLQALDAESTLRAIQTGKGREANPIISPFASNPAALVGFKMGATSALILSLDRLHRNHPRAATITLLAINAGYAFVVQHNYSVLSATHSIR